MALFEGPEDALGEQLGRLTGSFLVDAVLAFSTAGASTATTVIRQVAGVLRTVGRNLMRVVRMVARLIPRFPSVSSAASAACSAAPAAAPAACSGASAASSGAWPLGSCA
ncbi:MAG: hypothetical protein MZW92_40735 [Comamonadaceae bacterium]|nr:hypothetical protein [Comamonadaceae bacterium]